MASENQFKKMQKFTRQKYGKRNVIPDYKIKGKRLKFCYLFH